MSLVSFVDQSLETLNLVEEEKVKISIGISILSVGLFGFVVFLILYNIKQIKSNQG